MQALIMSIAIANGVDPNLLLAVCYKESKLQYVITPDDKGTPSYGLMQVKRIAARQVASEQNIETLEGSLDIGAKYLRFHLNRCTNLVSSINAFNRGHCYSKPTRYSNDVMKYYLQFKIQRLYENLY